ncbi:unnamed protein product [Rotaria sp. Silwood1]|nr:unnamed protein product [Rotaria sp. Silwood1]
MLSGTRNHRNSQLAEKIYDRMKSLFPDEKQSLLSGAFLLSNIYSSFGEYERAMDIRSKQKNELGLNIKVGVTWTMVNDELVEFKAHDVSHPRSEEIYAQLDRLTLLLLKHGHTEKLAIAFNLIQRPIPSIIQITKNLRICGDYHQVIKLIAKIQQCHIIVRDANRIHHFYPNGKCSCNIITIENEFLTLAALAQEWNQQYKKIDLSSMHLYSLINTFIDNPLKFTKNQLIEKLMHFLDWDTLLYRSDQPEELRQLQIKSWDPILLYINKEFHTNFQSTYDLHIKDLINKNDRYIIEKYFLNFDQSSLNIILFIVEQLKSILLTICLLKQYRSIENIATLSRLETEFQISHWSNVEYYHDYEMMDICSKISAAYLIFYCLNNNITRTILTNETN